MWKPVQKSNLSQPRILPEVEAIPHIRTKQGEKRRINIFNEYLRAFVREVLFTILASQALVWRPYLFLITLCHKESSSKGNRHSHLATKTMVLETK